LLDLITSTPERWAAYQQEARELGRIGPNVDIPFAEAQVLSRQFTVDLSIARHIGLELRALEPVLETLRARRWRLFVAPDGAGNFVTSDRPVALAHSDGAPERPDRPLGHGVPGTSVFFPISRSLFAVGSFESPGGVQELDAQGVALFNTVTFRNAYREVYCADSRDIFMHDGKRVRAEDAPALLPSKTNQEREELNVQAALD